MPISSSTLSAASTQNAGSAATATENLAGPGRVGDLAFRAGDPGARSDAHRSAMLRLNDPEHSLHHLRDKVKTFQKRDSDAVLYTLKNELQLPLPTHYNEKKWVDQQHISDLEYRLHHSPQKLDEKLAKELVCANYLRKPPSTEEGKVVVSPPSDPQSTAGVTNLLPDWEMSSLSPDHAARNIVMHETPVPGVGIAEKKNVRYEGRSLRYKDMEDRSFAVWISVSIGGQQIDMFLSAVLDGHGGSHYAQYAKDELPRKVEECLVMFNPPTGLTDLGIANALTQALIAVGRGAEVSDTGRFEHHAEGSTANLCLIYEGHIWVANLGDSRAIFVAPQADDTLQLSDDATAWLTTANGERVPHPRFEPGVTRRGGVIMGNGVDGSIAVARATGNSYLEGAISMRPKFTHIEVAKGTDLTGYFILQVSDGAHDKLLTETMALRVREGDAKQYTSAVIASQINQEACLSGSDDDVTVLVIKLDELEKPPAPTAAEA